MLYLFRRKLAAQILNYCLASACLVPAVLAQGPDARALKQAANDAENWLYHSHDYAGTRYSSLGQIHRGNVAQLRPECIFQVGQEGEGSEFQTGPLVHEGLMYITAGSLTIALDAATCRQRWRHRWQGERDATATNRGVAIQDGVVVRGTADGYLLALDSADGSEIWARQVADPALGEHFTMAPLIYEGQVIIGPAGGNNGISGWVGSFSLADGAENWRFATVPGAAEDIAGNELGISIGGGAVWTPLSLDVETETLFVAVTNPAPDLVAALQPGENLYSNSVLALNVNDGSLRWHRQMIEADDHGWELTQVSPLYEADIGGSEHKLLATVGKDGWLRALDRNSHETVFEAAVTRQENIDARVSINGTYTCPGVLGGVLWNGPALAPEEGLLITPALNLCSTFYLSSEMHYSEGRDYFDGTAVFDLETMSGWLSALDMRSGELRWRYEAPLPLVAAVTTSAGGLVMTGEMGGDFLVLDSSDGSELYRFHTGGAIGGGVITYAVEGRQYIAVVSGSPSDYQVNGDMGAPTIVVFALP